MRYFIAIIFITIIFFIGVSSVFARSGCCSWHGGVRADGCGCNDGTPLSSTCAPYYTCTYSAPIRYSTPTPIPPTATSIPTSTPVPPTATPNPTNTPTPTITPIITNTPTSNSDSQNTSQDVAGASTSSDNSSVSIVLGLLLLSGLVGGIYFKNKREKNKSSSDIS